MPIFFIIGWYLGNERKLPFGQIYFVAGNKTNKPSVKVRLTNCHSLSFRFLKFVYMLTRKSLNILMENHVLYSKSLARAVKVDCYLPTNVSRPNEMSLLL